MSRLALSLALILLGVAGCREQPPAAKASPPKMPERRPRDVAPVVARQAPAKATRAQVAEAVQEFAKQARSGSLADLAAEAKRSEFDLPPIDDERVLAAGLRKLSGQHITVFTDLPVGGAVEELPAVFDAAVPLWCAYFGVPTEKAAAWKLVGSVMKDKERFVRAGLYLGTLPDFANGYSVGSQIWLSEQPSDYYRRHLLLHEGTHAFMLRWLGGAGPPWYMEGMAELLATHAWHDGRLTMGVMPRTKQEAPYWGRVKIVRDEYAAGRGMSLIDIMRYDAHAHLQVEAYGWCWAAAAFLDAHGLTKKAFAELQGQVSDRTLEFSKSFYERLKGDWPAIAEDWQIFVADCDYGYDFVRAAVEREPAAALPATGARVTVKADHGWQSSGLRLEAGKVYSIHASGRFKLNSDPKPWISEADGITLSYSGGRPLGILLAAIGDEAAAAMSRSLLLAPTAVGTAGELTTEKSGTLYFKINEPAGKLADNSGTLAVEIVLKK